MNDAAVDVDAYLRRIAFAGNVEPSYETLAALVRAHAKAIPFENLDVLLGRPIRLDIDGVQRKLVGAQRGGYCFEHATLVAGVLDAIGLKPVLHAARVVLYRPINESPRGHMFLTVPIDGRTFVVDPGFGGLAADRPVALADGPIDSDAPHWMARVGAHWMLRTRSASDVVDCWATTLEADHRMDFDVANHYTATHPASPFRNRLMLRALTTEGTVTVMNRDVTHTTAMGARRSVLADRAALRTLLDAHFGFDLPEVESMIVPAIAEWR
jgi:N-hydroxyarylamine O-acetyltransferase